MTLSIISVALCVCHDMTILLFTISSLSVFLCEEMWLEDTFTDLTPGLAQKQLWRLSVTFRQTPRYTQTISFDVIDCNVVLGRMYVVCTLYLKLHLCFQHRHDNDYYTKRPPLCLIRVSPLFPGNRREQ